MSKKCPKGFRRNLGTCMRKNPIKNFFKGLNNGKTVAQRFIRVIGTVVVLLFSVLILRGLLAFGIFADLSPGLKVFWGSVGVTFIIFITLFLESVFGVQTKK